MKMENKKKKERQPARGVWQQRAVRFSEMPFPTKITGGWRGAETRPTGTQDLGSRRRKKGNKTTQRAESGRD